LKRKNRDAAGGPAPKRSRSIRITFNSLEDSEIIVQASGSNTNNARSHLSKKKGTSCLSTKGANYMLNDKRDDSDRAFNLLSVSQSEQGGMMFMKKYFQQMTRTFWSWIRTRDFVGDG
jgi:hypothetical protein